VDVESEIRDLKRRVGEIEGSFGFLTEQVKGVHRDLLGFQEGTEQRFDKIDGRLDKVEGEVRGLRGDMPGIVGDAMREVMQERDSS
jgi:tetrahydromethanopterin S-methyltransferase subunit G